MSTPIGNLGDITRRAVNALVAADLIVCEDTRVTGKLLSLLGITGNLLAYHDHNAAQRRPQILDRLAQGAAIALVSDAGTPLISDPGWRLVREAAASGYAVTHLPGASAPLAALVLSGLPTDRFLFVGFLPAKEKARREEIGTLASVPASLVIFEGPSRLAACLGDLAAGLGDRSAAVARELTKLHEEVRRGSLSDLVAHYREAGPPRGEIVIVVGPPVESPADEMELESALSAALASLSLRDAADMVATATGLPKKKVYARALALMQRQDGDA